MKQFQQIVDCEKIKKDAIAKAKQIAGNNIEKAIKLAKRFYEKMIIQAMCPIVDCKGYETNTN